MQSQFSTFLSLGFDHISDINAYDHIVFVIALCAIFSIKEWKKVLILVTAFTLGHSITLMLAALKIISFPAKIIEFLIPLTIFITALYNVIGKHDEKDSTSYDIKASTESTSNSLKIHYFFAGFFGLIHGMGFSNYFSSLLGKQANIVKPLFAFNVGIELGQLIIVGFILLASFLALNVLKVKKREWNLFISGMAAGISVILMMNTKFW